MKLDSEDRHSDVFPTQRGICQGSVLSPTLFLLVIDTLLRELALSSLGLTIDDFFVGSFAHADNIGTSLTAQPLSMFSWNTHWATFSEVS